MSCFVVIPAAGSGTRLKSDRPKQYLDLLGKPVIAHTVELFLNDQRFDQVVVALAEQDVHWQFSGINSSRCKTVIGGDSRQQSVLNALLAITAAEDDWVFVHDAARPCLTRLDLDALFAVLENECCGALLAAPVADTLKLVAGGRVQQTVDRSALWRALTPQVFRFGLLKSSLLKALQECRTVTDEASAIEGFGQQPKIVRGRDDNLKITQGQDLLIAENILRVQQQQGLRA